MTHEQNLLIVRCGSEGVVNKSYPAYRGVYRLGPRHVAHVEDSHEINRLVSWYNQEIERVGWVSDIGRARRLCYLWHEYEPKISIEIIEINTRNLRKCNGSYLGVDIANRFGLSLLANGMLSTPAEPPICVDHEVERQASNALVRIVAEYLRSRLNGNGLVECYEPAFYAVEALRLANMPVEVQGCEPISIYHID